MRAPRAASMLALLTLATSAATPASPAQDYMLFCQGCHGAQAEGVPGKVPPLAHSLGNYMRLPAGRDYVLRVPGASKSALTDAQLAGVMNWLAREYSAEEIKNGVEFFTAEEVTAHRHQPLPAVLAARAELLRAMMAANLPVSDKY
jgi:cytochrome c553